MGGKITNHQKFKQEVKKNLEIRNFLNIYNFVISSGVCPETSPAEWFEILTYMHTKGWLYVNFEDKKLSVVIGAYRIKEFDEKSADVMPKKEEGDILFINFAASKSEDKLALKKMLNKYIHFNPRIKEIILYDRNSSEKIKKFKIGGDKNGQQESIVTASNADVSGQPVGVADTK
jgi:hypothetical protein